MDGGWVGGRGGGGSGLVMVVVVGVAMLGGEDGEGGGAFAVISEPMGSMKFGGGDTGFSCSALRGTPFFSGRKSIFS